MVWVGGRRFVAAGVDGDRFEVVCLRARVKQEEEEEEEEEQKPR